MPSSLTTVNTASALFLLCGGGRGSQRRRTTGCVYVGVTTRRTLMILQILPKNAPLGSWLSVPERFAHFCSLTELVRELMSWTRCVRTRDGNPKSQEDCDSACHFLSILKNLYNGLWLCDALLPWFENLQACVFNNKTDLLAFLVVNISNTVHLPTYTCSQGFFFSIIPLIFVNGALHWLSVTSTERFTLRRHYLSKAKKIEKALLEMCKETWCH